MKLNRNTSFTKNRPSLFLLGKKARSKKRTNFGRTLNQINPRMTDNDTSRDEGRARSSASWNVEVRKEGGEVDDRGKCQGVESVAGVQVPPGCRYFAVQSGGKLFTGLFKRNLLKLTDFISRPTQPRGATPDYTLTKLAAE